MKKICLSRNLSLSVLTLLPDIIIHVLITLRLGFFFSVFKGISEILQQMLKNPSLASVKGSGTDNKIVKRFK